MNYCVVLSTVVKLAWPQNICSLNIELLILRAARSHSQVISQHIDNTVRSAYIRMHTSCTHARAIERTRTRVLLSALTMSSTAFDPLLFVINALQRNWRVLVTLDIVYIDNVTSCNIDLYLDTAVHCQWVCDTALPNLLMVNTRRSKQTHGDRT